MSDVEAIVDAVERVLNERVKELQEKRGNRIQSGDGSLAIDFSTSAHLEEVEHLRYRIIDAIHDEVY